MKSTVKISMISQHLSKVQTVLFPDLFHNSFRLAQRLLIQAHIDFKKERDCMKILMTKVLSAAGLMVTLVLAACGSNQCPSGQTMYNGVCTYTNGAYGNGTQCGVGQVYTQYGCLSQGSCQAGMGSYNGQCIPGSQTGYNNGYYGNNGTNQCAVGQVLTQMGCLSQGACQPNYGYYNGWCLPGTGNGMNGGMNSCQNGFVYTMTYGCLPQNGCPAGMGMGAFGCTR